MSQLYFNNLKLALAAAVTTAAQTNLTIAEANLLPAISAPDYVLMTFKNSLEIIKITSHIAGSASLTVVRGQEGSVAQTSYAIGDIFECRITAGFLNMLPPPPGVYHKLVVNASQLWTVPANVIGMVRETVQGGGGNSTQGGSGAMRQKEQILIPGEVIQITVGGKGGSSSFGTYATALGAVGTIGGGSYHTGYYTLPDSGIAITGVGVAAIGDTPGQPGVSVATFDGYYVGGGGGGGASASCMEFPGANNSPAPSIFGPTGYGAGNQPGVVILEWYEAQ